MSWELKVAILERQGRTHEEAMREVMSGLEAANKAMDLRLAACVECMTDDQVKSVFGELY